MVQGSLQSVDERRRDAAFGVLFLAHFLLVSLGAVAFGTSALQAGGSGGGTAPGTDYNPFAGLQTDDVIILGEGRTGGGVTAGRDMTGISRIDCINVLQLVGIAGGFAAVCSLLALWFAMMLARNLLQTALVLALGGSASGTLISALVGAGPFPPLVGLLLFVLLSLYALVVWDTVPFAGTNLRVALKGMRCTLDIPCAGVGVLALTFAWTIWWICAFVGTFNFLNGAEELSNGWMSVVMVFFVFSYYWTFQVIKVGCGALERVGFV